MTIQRQYSLPNCTLVLEGVGNDSLDPTTRPVLTMLVNAECRFVGYNQPVSGGSDFFESLVKTVSRYAQEVLSGITAPLRHKGEVPLVQLHRGDRHLHHLTVRSASGSNGSQDGGALTELKLTTVQLFDLVEAIDQALADTQTLPHLSLNLQPISRRHAASGEPLAKRAVPAAVGVSSLAIAAVALFFLPVPEVRRIEEPAEQSSVESVPTTTSNALTTATGSPPDSDSDSVSATSTSPEPTSPEPTSPDVAALEETLETAPPITDRATVVALNETLRDEIDRAWQQEPTFDTDLVYRVAINEEGDIVGYKYVNDAALTYVEETPFPDLAYITPEGSSNREEPIAQFKVVMTPGGALEVSPWYALPEASAATAPDGDAQSGGEITDIAAIEQLNEQLYDLLQEEREPNTFPGDLVYRVTFNEAGQILDFQPATQAAKDYVNDTPLPELEQPPSGTAASRQARQSNFKVVFTEGGVLQVSPWDGWQ